MNKALTLLLLLGLTCLCSAPAAHGQAVTGLMISTHVDPENQCGAGWEWIAQDLNEKADGDYIYLCTQRGSGTPITAITATSHPEGGNRCPSGWGWIDIDLNEGIDFGNYIYLCYQRGGGDPIEAVEITSSDSPGNLCGGSHWSDEVASDVLLIDENSNEPWPMNWTWVDVDLNHTVQGKYIYLCYGKDAEVDLLPSPSEIESLSALDFDVEDPFLMNLVGDSWEQQMMAKLDEFSRVGTQYGYQPTSAQWIQTLRSGQNRDHYLTLRGGYDYSIAAFCDTDCGHIDLALYGPSGQQMEVDTLPSNEALVMPQNPGTGRYRLQVRMYRCSTPTCYYGMRVNARWARSP